MRRRRYVGRNYEWVDYELNDYTDDYGDPVFSHNRGIYMENTRRALQAQYLQGSPLTELSESWTENLVSPIKRKFFKSIKRENDMINYLCFSDTPYLRYMPLYDYQTHNLYLVNKNFWESIFWNTKIVCRNNKLVSLELVNEIRFLNNYNPIPNCFFPRLYNSSILNNDYLKFLKKYNIIGGGIAAQIPCWILPLNEISSNINIDNLYISTDKKKIESKVVNIGYLVSFD